MKENVKSMAYNCKQPLSISIFLLAGACVKPPQLVCPFIIIIIISKINPVSEKTPSPLGTATVYWKMSCYNMKLIQFNCY